VSENVTIKTPMLPKLPPKTYIPRLEKPKSMTVCVGGIFEDADGPAIVVAADNKLSWGHDSLENGTVKIRRINANWIYSFASNDAGFITPIMADLRKDLVGKAALGDVVKAVKKVHKTRIYSGMVLMSLVAGFDAQEKPHLFSIENHNPEMYADDSPGFAAIGSGQFIAKDVLHTYPYSRFLNLSEAVYCIAIAKFSSERAEGVSAATDLCVIRPNQTIAHPESVPVVDPDMLDQIRGRWWSLPRIPEGMGAEIAEYLNTKKNFLF
jgi:20S proteasome alpha/beta subunit